MPASPRGLDHDRVADREPALELHEDAAQDVDQEALRGEAQQQHEQRRARDRPAAAHARQLR